MSTLELFYRRLPDRVNRFVQEILYDDGTLLITQQKLALNHPLVIQDQIVLDTGYEAIWFIFMDACYDVGCIYTPSGCFSGYYCDTLLPPRRQGNTVWMTDLFLDLWIGRDGRWAVLDTDELEEAQRQGWIEPETAQVAWNTMDILIEWVKHCKFPPDPISSVICQGAGQYRTQKGARHVARTRYAQRFPVIQRPGE